jgi:CDP-diacylglycerol--glycerol-3-phosphate 3-phosphatidyltransferase
MNYQINLATSCTLLRIVCAPCIVIALHYHAYILALFFFVVAAVTDFLDGYFARRYHQETAFGKLLDPLADKILLCTTLGALYYEVGFTYVPAWFVYGIGIKESLLLSGGLLLLALCRTHTKP